MLFFGHRLVLAVCVVIGATVASAQDGASTGAKAVPEAVGLNYTSAFTQYRPYADQPVVAWSKANATVGSIGGWQAYARESQGIGTAAKADVPSNATPATSPTPGSTAERSGGHDSHAK